MDIINRINSYLIEGKIKVVKGKYIEFPTGEITSLPDRSDEYIVLSNNKGSEVRIGNNQTGITVDVNNKWDKQFKNIGELRKWLNKERYINFIGIDDI